jgi:hypothetical protein
VLLENAMIKNVVPHETLSRTAPWPEQDRHSAVLLAQSTPLNKPHDVLGKNCRTILHRAVDKKLQ